jgi:undecaprenyl-diphosphatase
MEKFFNKKNTIIVTVFIVLFKILLSAFTELHPDEAYYWLWSQNLAVGYYDHAPMVAWFIKMTTLFSNSELSVRFTSIVVTLILSLLMWKFVKKLFDETIASASIIVLNTLPLMLAASIIITPDTPAFLFFAFTVYFLWRLIESNKTKYWYITGLFFGLTMLSKYTGILFGVSLFAYMILDRKLKWFKNKHFYLMFIVSLIVFLPVIIWNSQHEWISFAFQFKHGLSNSKLHFDYIFEYLSSQCLIAGPIIFIFGIVAAFLYFKSKDSKKLFLLSFSIPIIGFFIFTALKRLPGANWPSFAYFAFSIMTAQYLLENKSKIKRKILLIGVVFNVIISVLLGLHIKYMIFPIYKFSQKTAIADATNWFTGWKVLGDNLLKRDIKYAVADSHQWGAIIAYYTKGTIKTFLDNTRQNQFAYWSIPDDLATSKTAVVKIDHYMDEDFSKVNNAEVVQVKRNSFPIRQYAIIETEGYEIKNKKMQE